MNKAFICQSVSKFYSEKSIGRTTFLDKLSTESNALTTDIDDRSLGCQIERTHKAIKSNASQVYETLAESEDNKLIQPQLKLTVSKNTSTDFIECVKTKVIPGCIFYDEIEVLFFDKITIINWELHRNEDTFEEIYSLDKDLVEAELSLIGKRVSDYIYNLLIKAGLISNYKNKSYELLWTTRVLIITKSDQPPSNENWIEKWMGDKESVFKVESANANFHAGWGNHLIVAGICDDLINKFSEILASIQSIYARLHLLNKVVTSHLDKLHIEDVGKADLLALKKIEHDFFYIEYSLLEAEHSLQGFQRQVLFAYLNAWRMKELIKNMNYKLEKIRLLVSEIVRDKYSFVQKNIRAMLFLIGTIEAVGAAVEIVDLAFSHEAIASPQFGILKLIRYTTPDMIITTLFVFLMILASVAFLLNVPENKD